VGGGARLPGRDPDVREEADLPGADALGSARLSGASYLKDDELEELEELDEPPPPPPEELDELEELEDELVLLLDELALGELELGDEDDEVAPVGLSPPQAASIPTPARAAPPESRTRNSRLSVSASSSSRTRLSSATVASSLAIKP
jgi:hypothetical protein